MVLSIIVCVSRGMSGMFFDGLQVAWCLGVERFNVGLGLKRLGLGVLGLSLRDKMQGFMKIIGLPSLSPTP